MQTTLLGLAIAIILALLAALVGPFFVDWGRYRTTFEAEASRLVGQPVRVAGPIDVRVLPAPSLILGGIEIGKPGTAALRARSLGVEFGLGPLVRGEFRAVQATLAGPDVTLGVDASGKVDLPEFALGSRLDAVAIDKLNVEDGRIVLAHAASGSRIVLEKLSFNGEMRSLAGPFKGEGAAVVAGGLYGYRLAAGRVEDSGVRLKFNIEPSDRPLTIEGEGLLALERGEPRFDGNISLARPAGTVLAGGQTVLNEPWRATAKVKGRALSALFEQIDVQYGPEDRVIKLGGTAEFKFGNRPRLEGVLSARQLDLDRLLHSPDIPRRLPPAAIQVLAERFVGGARPSFPMQIGIGIDAVTVSGSIVQNLRGDIKIDADALSLEGFELRMPGATQIQLSGRFDVTPAGVEFVGPVDVVSGDPKALMSWLDGRAEPPPGPSRPLRARGDVALGGGRIVIDRLKAEIDRKAFEGRLAYAWASGDRPARLDAEVNAAELDIDAMLYFATGALAGTRFDRPGEIALAFDIGRATILGVEARNAKAKIRYDGKGLQIERLSIADLGGTAMNAIGRIDTTAPSPRGSLTLDLDARELSGVAALLATFAPASGDTVRRLAERLAPAKLRATLEVDAAAAGGARSLARLALAGSVGAMRINLAGNATGEFLSPKSTDLRLEGRIDADEGGQLLSMLGLGRALAADRRPQQWSLTVQGPLNGELRVESRLAGELDANLGGTLRLSGDHGASGALTLVVAKADLRRLRPPVAGKAPDPLPLALRSRIEIAGGTLTFSDISGNAAGAPLRGRLVFSIGAPSRLEGRIEADAIDAAALVAAGIGMPAQAANIPPGNAAPWPAEPFQAGLYPEIAGQIEFKTARAAVTPSLAAKDLSGRLRLSPSAFAVEDLKGEMAGGQLAGQLSFRRGADGVAARGRVALTGADAALVIPGGQRPAINGRVTLQLEADGAGLSPKALIGSLGGTGMVTLEGAQIAGLDAKAFPAVMRAADQGLAIDSARVANYLGPALDAGRLSLPQVDTAITITAGQARIGTVVARGDGADIAVSGTYELADGLIDARLTLTGPRAPNVGGSRPEVGIMLKGPLAAPRRTLDVAALSGWLALRSVEQQAKRVEEAERLAAEHARQEAERARQREEAERLAAIKAREDAERQRALTQPIPFLIPPASTGEPRPAIGVPDQLPAIQAPALPPPIEIKPAIGSDAAPTQSVPPPRPRNPQRQSGIPGPGAPLDLGLVGAQR